MRQTSRRRWLAACAAVTAAAAAPVTASATPAPGLLHVISPSHEALLDGAVATTLEVRHAGGVRITAIEVNGRTADPRIGRAASGRLRVFLSAEDGLRHGPNTVAIHSRRGASTDADVLRLTHVAHRRDLADIVLPRDGARIDTGPVTSTIAVPRHGAELRVSLNGRVIPRSQWEGRWHGGMVRLELTATDGLRHGANVLLVTAQHGHGVEVLQRRFRITGTRPLASAGPHRVVRPGEHVTLDGRASVFAPRAGVRIAEEEEEEIVRVWEITSAPDGSEATLDDPASPTPVLRTDLPGVYTVSMVVRRGEASAPASVTVVARDPGLTPVVMGPAGRPARSIQIGQDLFTPSTRVARPVLNVVTISRTTGAVIPGTTATLGSSRGPIAAFRDKLKRLGSDAMVFVESDGSSATREITDLTGGPRAVWIPHTGRWVAPGAMRGHLMDGDGGQLTFTRGEYARFRAVSGDTGSNTVTVGAQTFTVTLPEGVAGGYQVLRLDPVTLGLRANTMVPTRASRGGRLPRNAPGLNDTLGARGIGGDLVFVVSVGAPGATVLDLGTIERLGGTPETLAAMDDDGAYALVHSPGREPLEAGTVIQSDRSQRSVDGAGPVQVDGFLSRQADGTMAAAPALPVPSGGASFSEVVFRDAVAWPHSTTPEQRAALGWFAQRLSLPGTDPRTSYTNQAIDLDIRYATLLTLTFPGAGNGFAEQDFLDIKADLTREIAAVQDVRTLMSALRSTYGRAGLRQFADIAGQAQIVKDAVTPPPVSNGFNLLQVLGGAALAGGKLTSGPTSQALGFAGEVLTVASELTPHEPAADPTVVVSRDATALQSEVPERIEGYVTYLGGIEDAIVTDSGRLAAAEAEIAAGRWTWSNTIADQNSQAFRLSVQREAWVSLVGTVYRTYRLDTKGGTNRTSRGAFICWGSNLSSPPLMHEVYRSTDPPAIQSWTATQVPGIRSGSGAVARVIARKVANDYFQWARMPPPGVLPDTISAPVFTAVTGNPPGDLAPMGMYPPRFAARLQVKVLQCSRSAGPILLMPGAPNTTNWAFLRDE